jgi:hypothetical protein
LGNAATTGLLYQPRMIGDGDCGEIGGMKIGRENRSTRKKTYPSAILSITNPTWLDPGRRGGKPQRLTAWAMARSTGNHYFLPDAKPEIIANYFRSVENTYKLDKHNFRNIMLGDLNTPILEWRRGLSA